MLDAFIKEMEQDQDAKDAVELPPNGETGHGLRPSASHAGAFTVVPSTFVDHSGALQSVHPTAGAIVMVPLCLLCPSLPLLILRCFEHHSLP